MLYFRLVKKMYLVEKTLNKLYNNGYTFFLNPKDLKEVTNHLKKNSYEILKSNEYSEKNIIYLKKPEIVLLEIKVNAKLRHQDILGSLFSLKIDDGLFGDILIINGKYYFYTFKEMKTFFEMEFTKIGKNNIKLEEKELNYLDSYEPEFEEMKIITSSLRIDAIIAKVIHTNRDGIKDLIKDKKITYNYELLKNGTKTLKIGDVFSVRKYGKYRFESIEANTKKDNLIIKIFKYNEKNNML